MFLKALHLPATWFCVFSEEHMLLISEFCQHAFSGNRKRQHEQYESRKSHNIIRSKRQMSNQVCNEEQATC